MGAKSWTRLSNFTVLLIYSLSVIFSLDFLFYFQFFLESTVRAVLHPVEGKGSILYQAPGWGWVCCTACSALSAACSRVCCPLLQSSLLSAVLGELPPSQGKVHGRIAYVSQHPWLFPGTVKSNILFGKKYKKRQYEKVTNACALKEVSNDL